ncbi:MaoC family dehydratase N-terminal domain-containing protein, partial [Acidiphilium sp. C61]|uniref:FAS1-like dehydratase domain-containing protein n=1 Tax=Acidiphilium sp. C61 TaxID=1671485 RepID=UPI001F2FA5C2
PVAADGGGRAARRRRAPARGGFLPPVPLPRRMWAGGALEFHDTLRVGDTVRRSSEIGDVVVKQGRTGTLCFVTVRHTLATAGGGAARAARHRLSRP